jgi:hypothetical protein
MAQVIEELLIGIGLETDKKSFQGAENSLDGLASKALQIGAIVAGAFGVDALTFGFAERIDELGKFGERWNVAANDVAAYDKALGLAGGTQGEFLGTIRNLSKALTLAPFERAQLLGEMSKFGIGNQINEVLNAGSALDAFLVSADQLNSLQGKQKEKFIEAMGFGESEVRLLSQGRAEILKVVNQQKKMAPVTQKMTDTAAKFNDEYQNMNTNLSGFSDKIATPLTAAIAEIMVGMNGWADANREVVNSMLEIGGGALADNIGTISTVMTLLGGAKMLGGLTAAAGKIGLISAGMTTAGTAASALLGKLGLLAAAGAVGWAIGSEISKQLDDDTNVDIGRTIAKTLAFFGNDEAQRSLDAEDVAGGFTENYTQPILHDREFAPHDRKAIRAERSERSQAQTIKVEVNLDGAPVKAIVKTQLDEQNEQLVQDFATSNRG